MEAVFMFYKCKSAFNEYWSYNDGLFTAKKIR